MWLGWSGRTQQAAPAGVPFLSVDSNHPVRAALDLEETQAEAFSRFCSSSLWPLMHGAPRPLLAESDYEKFVSVNRLFASAATRVGARARTVWVHDFPLLLVASELRKAGYLGRIGFFLHVPFPSVDALETFPWAPEMLEAMRAADLVGFHTSRYVDNYLAAQRTLLGAKTAGDTVESLFGSSRAIALPLGIDPEPFSPNRFMEEDPEMRHLVEATRGRKLLVGVDRLDVTKGIPERLLAFEKLLERFPDWRRKASFVQITLPVREDVYDYDNQRRTLEGIVGRINGTFGDADWVPVRNLYRAYGQEQLTHLFRVASVAVVTPLRDGMNLIAKEFVAAQDGNDPGVLVLSKLAGAAGELTGALITNPFHVEQVARDLDRALSMSLVERQSRHASLFDRVGSMTSSRWARRFLEVLEQRD